MYKFKNRLSFFLFCFPFVFLFFCTSNPLENDEVSTSGKIIKGKISLSDNTSPENVYVWLDAFNIGTFTDADGEFVLTISKSSAQSDDGVSGHFYLYFYVANYSVDSASVALRKGVVQTGQGDINEDGEVNKPIELKKLLNVSITSKPSSYPYFTEILSVIHEMCDLYTGYEEPLTVLVELSAHRNPIYIKCPDTSTGPVSIIFLKNIDTESQFTKMLVDSATVLNSPLVFHEITKISKDWIAGFKLEPDMLPKGKYQIIPYFFVQQDAIPDQLLNSLYSEQNIPGLDFINIPMKREYEILEIK